MSKTFRQTYRALSSSEKELIEEIKRSAEHMESLYQRSNMKRYYSLAMTNLEQSVMWIVKEITD